MALPSTVAFVMSISLELRSFFILETQFALFLLGDALAQVQVSLDGHSLKKKMKKIT